MGSTRKEAKKNEFVEKLRAAKSKKLSAAPKSTEKPEAPTLYPDLYWVWAAFCFLHERRQVGPAGPQPITVEAMLSYAELAGHTERVYLDQIRRFIPLMDNEYLHDFYKKQEEEYEKMRRKHDQQQRLGNTRRQPSSRQIGR